MYITDNYDVVVIGAGHAGVEAALAAARLGGRTLLATLSLDNIALMPCNPSVGGPAKGHLVREIDALGGQMGLTADEACIQMRLLNTGKGYAVHALRAQADKPFKSGLVQFKRLLVQCRLLCGLAAIQCISDFGILGFIL